MNRIKTELVYTTDKTFHNITGNIYPEVQGKVAPQLKERKLLPIVLDKQNTTKKDEAYSFKIYQKALYNKGVKIQQQANKEFEAGKRLLLLKETKNWINKVLAI